MENSTNLSTQIGGIHVLTSILLFFLIVGVLWLVVFLTKKVIYVAVGWIFVFLSSHPYVTLLIAAAIFCSLIPPHDKPNDDDDDD